VSVGQLFLAGVVPGVLMSLFMFLVTWWLCKKRNYPREERATPREVRIALADGVLALIAPAVIVGSIVAGIATPTESAAIAVGYTLFLGLVVYRNTSLAALMQAAGTAAAGSALVMLTVAASQIFAWLAVQERLGEILSGWMLGISANLYVVLMLANLLMLVLGMFMELVPVMFILAPILFPLVASMGMSEVQFGVVMTLNLMIGMITPPIGLNLMVLSAITGEDVMRIFRASLPYVWALLVVLLLITYIPQLTLFLPQLFYPAK
jgi:tripartite ATP-independent transporter DctM subunit